MAPHGAFFVYEIKLLTKNIFMIVSLLSAHSQFVVENLLNGERRLQMRRLMVLVSTLVVVSFLTGCVTQASDWTRRDMPTDGLEYLVTYSLTGPAGTEKEVNQAVLRGVNEFAPITLQTVTFNRMSGSKTQDVAVTLPDGRVYQGLGMNKPKRFAGLTRFMTLEPATFAAADLNGNAICGAKIRLDFNRNFMQYADAERKDYQSLWYYDVPCEKQGAEFMLDLNNATLRALVINQVWQFRIASSSYLFNWGHSVTAIGGPAAQMPGGWWKNWDIPDSETDTMAAAKIVNEMVLDLESSQMPWLEFKQDGAYKDAYLIYSAGDADKYANFDRIFLNRQKEYAVFYRPNPQTPWDWIRIVPFYNMEWNDVADNLRALKGWVLDEHLDKQGLPKDANDEVVKELERVGFINAPNADLDQIRWYGSDDSLLYVMTVRAFIGASDSLIMFGRGEPDFGLREKTGSDDQQPMPMVYDQKGQPLSPEKQPYTAEQWAQWQRETTFWNFLKDNPQAVSADLMIQYRFADNTQWAPVTCNDSDGHSYVCGYTPVEWNLSTSYYFDGDVRTPWLVSQLLGEVGVRTLGMSYVSGRFEGTGLLFAMAQLVHRQEFLTGYTAESLWRFDARASQLPETLAEAWKALHNR